MTTTLNAYEDFQPTLAVKFTDRHGIHTTLDRCSVKLCAKEGLVFQSQQSSIAPIALPKQQIIAIARQECSHKKGIHIQSSKSGIVHAEVSFASPSSALALLHSMDHLWPDVRMDYCECAAALLTTCTRAKSDQVDRQVWPWALLTLVEWDPLRGRHEIEGVETSITAMDDCFVFHLNGMESAPTLPHNTHPSLVARHIANWKPKPLHCLHVRRNEILEPPVAIIQPFIGTKLRLSSSKYAYVQIEIPNKSDLYAFMSTMLYPWGQQISLKRSHSASITAEMQSKTARSSLAADDLKTANSSFTHSCGETTANTARSISDHTLRTLITPELSDAIVPPPAKRARKPTDFFTVSSSAVVLRESTGGKAVVQLTNVGTDRAVFRIRHTDRSRYQYYGQQLPPPGKHQFTATRAFVEAGKTFELKISRDPKEAKATGYYTIDFARASADFQDAAEAISKSNLAGSFDIVVQEV